MERSSIKIAFVSVPLMKILGLPGEAALMYILGALLNNYLAIAVMSSMNQTLHDATILYRAHSGR